MMHTDHILYFAYGSNMHPERMQSRAPLATRVAVARLPGHSLCFHKRSWKDGSGKCNAFFTDRQQDEVIGVVYRISMAEKEVLDKHEGAGNGYEINEVAVFAKQEKYNVFTYMASETHIDNSLMPFSWYRDYVEYGARYHKLPDSYIEVIRKAGTVEDPDQTRAAKERMVLKQSENNVG